MSSRRSVTPTVSATDHLSTITKAVRLPVEAWKDAGLQHPEPAASSAPYAAPVLLTVSELIALAEETPTFWHLIWKHDAAARELVGQRPHVPYDYAIDLDRCQTAAQCLDWLLHIRGKTWGTWLVVGALVEAMSAVLDLQRMVK